MVAYLYHFRGLLNGPYATVHSQGLMTQISPTLLNRIERSYQRFRKEYQQPIQCRYFCNNSFVYILKLFFS